MKRIYSGLESSGKSLKIAEEVFGLIYRNARYLKMGLPMRPIYSNMHFAQWVIDYAHERGIDIRYWRDLDEIIFLEECDIIIDEVGTYFDSRLWSTLSLETRLWLAQGAKKGVDIYGTAQDFAQVDLSFRRLTNELIHVTKFMGSTRPCKTKPGSKWIWGLCFARDVDPVGYKESDAKVDATGWPSFFFIHKKYTMMYDTQEKIERPELPKLKHREQFCEHYETAGSMCYHNKTGIKITHV